MACTHRRETRIPWGAWAGDEEFPLRFPSTWDVEIVQPAPVSGIETAALARAIDRPIGTAPLEQLVRPGESVAIAVDDITRPLCVGPVLELVLERLQSVGVEPRQVRVIVATGLHGDLEADEVRQKVGARAADLLDVLCHDPLDAGVELTLDNGKTARVSRDFMAADRRFTISTVSPHLYSGYSGGAKIVMPGLAAASDVAYTHKSVLMGLTGAVRQVAGNRFRDFLEKVALAVGVDFSIQLVCGSRRAISAAFVGDIVKAHRAAVDYADEIYASPFPEGLDVVVLNAYPKDTELLQCENSFIPYKTAQGLLRDDGIVVLTTACSRGIGRHGLFGPGELLHRTPRPMGFLRGRHLIVFSPRVTADDFRCQFWEGYSFHPRWDAVLDELSERYGDSCRVGVFPSAPLQVPSRASS